MKQCQDFSILHQHTRMILARARAQRQELERQLNELAVRRRQKQNRARQASLSNFHMQSDASRQAGLPDMAPSRLPDCPSCTLERGTLS